MTHIPNVYLMIHANDLEYLDNVLKKISPELLFNFRERVIFVQRSSMPNETLKMKNWCKAVFGDKNLKPVWDEKNQFQTA